MTALTSSLNVERGLCGDALGMLPAYHANLIFNEGKSLAAKPAVVVRSSPRIP